MKALKANHDFISSLTPKVNSRENGVADRNGRKKRSFYICGENSLCFLVVNDILNPAGNCHVLKVTQRSEFPGNSQITTEQQKQSSGRVPYPIYKYAALSTCASHSTSHRTESHSIRPSFSFQSLYTIASHPWPIPVLPSHWNVDCRTNKFLPAKINVNVAVV